MQTADNNFARMGELPGKTGKTSEVHLMRERLRQGRPAWAVSEGERVLIETVITKRIVLDRWQGIYESGTAGLTPSRADYLQRRMAAAHQRYMGAVKALSAAQKVRKV